MIHRATRRANAGYRGRKCRARDIEQCADGVGQNIFEPRPPAVRPHMPNLTKPLKTHINMK
jgi:hypothetical protein